VNSEERKTRENGGLTAINDELSVSFFTERRSLQNAIRMPHKFARKREEMTFLMIKKTFF